MASEGQGAIARAVKDAPVVEAAQQQAAASIVQPAAHLASASDASVSVGEGSQASPPTNASAPGYPMPVSDEPQAWTPRSIRRA